MNKKHSNSIEDRYFIREVKIRNRSNVAINDDDKNKAAIAFDDYCCRKTKKKEY
jgi:hypothetical protein